MPRKRLYTERDVSAILRRATELQRKQGVDDTAGLTLEELAEVADDVGINPDLVRRAALEMEDSRVEKGDLLLGGPTEVDREWMVDGAMSDTKWENALGEIRRAFAAEGEVRREGDTWDWIHRDQMGGRIHVSMSPAGSRTRVRVSYGMKEWLWLYVVFLSMGIGAVAVQYAVLSIGALVETGIGLFIMLAFYMVGWLSFRVFSRRQERKVQRLLAQLDNLLAEPSADEAQGQRLAPPDDPARMDDSLLDAEQVADEARHTGQRGRTSA